MFNKTFLVALLALALSAHAAPHHRYGHDQADSCSVSRTRSCISHVQTPQADIADRPSQAGSAVTVTAIQTVTVTAGTSAATSSAVLNNGGDGGAVAASVSTTSSHTGAAAYLID